MANGIVEDSVVGIMVGQCSVLCQESPKGDSACGKLLGTCKIIVVQKSGEGTCIGC